MTLEIQVLPWDRHNNVQGLSWLIGFQASSLDNWIFNGNRYFFFIYYNLRYLCFVPVYFIESKQIAVVTIQLPSIITSVY